MLSASVIFITTMMFRAGYSSSLGPMTTDFCLLIIGIFRDTESILRRLMLVSDFYFISSVQINERLIVFHMLLTKFVQ